MSDAWKQLDLEGGGLQTVNLMMTKYQRHTRTAYLLWLAFPLGLHRFYLKSAKLALVYPALSLLSIASWLAFGILWSLPGWLALIGFATFDVFGIERRVVELNKALRMALYLQKDAAPPPGYRGRYHDDSEDILKDYLQEKSREKAGILPPQASDEKTPPGKRVFSFAEQEAMLKEMKRGKKTSS